MLMQRDAHGAEIRTLHVLEKKSRLLRTGTIFERLVHTSFAKPSHLGRQIARQLSCKSAVTGGPMDRETSAMHVATESTARLAENIEEMCSGPSSVARG
jgi:hypothetical protein